MYNKRLSKKTIVLLPALALAIGLISFSGQKAQANGANRYDGYRSYYNNSSNYYRSYRPSMDRSYRYDSYSSRYGHGDNSNFRGNRYNDYNRYYRNY